MMRLLGIFVLVVAVTVTALMFGGFIAGNINVEMTDKGRSVFNNSLEKAAEGIDHLRVEDNNSKAH